jgi:hypothetical protein
MAQIRQVYKIYMKSSEGSQNMAGFFFFLFSYSFCSQIWLNNNVIDCQWSYIRKLRAKRKKKKKPFSSH